MRILLQGDIKVSRYRDSFSKQVKALDIGVSLIPGKVFFVIFEITDANVWSSIIGYRLCAHLCPHQLTHISFLKNSRVLVVDHKFQHFVLFSFPELFSSILLVSTHNGQVFLLHQIRMRLQGIQRDRYRQEGIKRLDNRRGGTSHEWATS